MIQIPDQMTGAQLRSLLDETEAELRSRPRHHPRVEAELERVRGGRVVDGPAAGYVRIQTGGEVVESPLLSPEPLIELTWRWTTAALRHHVYVPSTAVRVVAVDGVWREGGFYEAPHRDIRVELGHREPRRRTVITVAVPRGVTDLIMGPASSSLPSADPDPRFLVPPSATWIWGRGVVLYNTGHRLPLDGVGPVALSRVDATGELAFAPGSVYAEFRGPEPAHVRVGNSWITTPPV